MSSVDESEGTQGPDRTSSPSPLPEGAKASNLDYPPQRPSMPVFRRQSESAVGLDMLVELDEPELLIKRLKLVALGQNGEKWVLVVAHADACLKEFEIYNRPRQR